MNPVSFSYYIVLGSSTGLGRELVDQLFQHTGAQIWGLARTALEELPRHQTWSSEGRYCHFAFDLVSPEGRDCLREIAQELAGQRVCVILNAALVTKDVEPDGQINFARLEATNRLGIDSLAYTLEAFEGLLLERQGVFVAISSFSSLVPAVVNPGLAYAATKAYMNMFVDSLRLRWQKRAQALTVYLGLLAEEAGAPVIGATAYRDAAQQIVQALSQDPVPEKIAIPWVGYLIYRVFALLPLRLYASILSLVLKLTHRD